MTFAGGSPAGAATGDYATDGKGTASRPIYPAVFVMQLSMFDTFLGPHIL